MTHILKTDEELPDYDDLAAQEDLIEKEPWDVLICLDACRWDAYQRVYGEASPVRTPSEHSTIGWMKDIWCNPEYDWSDVTYISANDMTAMVGEGREHFTDVPNIEQSVDEYIGLSPDEWNVELRTVPPQAFLNNRDSIDPPTVLHFIQPHVPYTCGGFRFDIQSDNYPLIQGTDEEGCFHRPSRLAREGYVDSGIIEVSYISNLEATVRAVEQIANRYDTVITSDHGEAFGPDVWDHGGPYTNRNRVVPWDARYVGDV